MRSELWRVDLYERNGTLRDCIWFTDFRTAQDSINSRFRTSEVTLVGPFRDLEAEKESHKRDLKWAVRAIEKEISQKSLTSE